MVQKDLYNLIATSVVAAVVSGTVVTARLVVQAPPEGSQPSGGTQTQSAPTPPPMEHSAPPSSPSGSFEGSQNFGGGSPMGGDHMMPTMGNQSGPSQQGDAGYRPDGGSQPSGNFGNMGGMHRQFGESQGGDFGRNVQFGGEHGAPGGMNVGGQGGMSGERSNFGGFGGTTAPNFAGEGGNRFGEMPNFGGQGSGREGGSMFSRQGQSTGNEGMFPGRGFGTEGRGFPGQGEGVQGGFPGMNRGGRGEEGEAGRRGNMEEMMNRFNKDGGRGMEDMMKKFGGESRGRMGGDEHGVSVGGGFRGGDESSEGSHQSPFGGRTQGRPGSEGQDGGMGQMFGGGKMNFSMPKMNHLPSMDDLVEAADDEGEPVTLSEKEVKAVEKLVTSVVNADRKTDKAWAQLEPRLEDGVSTAEGKKLMTVGRQTEQNYQKAQAILDRIGVYAEELDEEANATFFAVYNKLEEVVEKLGSRLETVSTSYEELQAQ